MMYVWSKLSAAKWEDAWEERFHGPLRTGLAITRLPGGRTIRVEVYCERRSDAARIQKEFGGQIRELKQQNWAAKAAESLRPVMIRNTLIITHSTEAAEKMRAAYPERKVLCIPGEMAFGTGDHATTATCLRLLADYAEAKKRAGQPWSLMDLGCGTGILAIAAALLGAKPVEGFDFDPAAVKVANKNSKANGSRGLKFTRDDVTTWKPARQYDVVAANIFYDVLTLSFDRIAAAAKPGGMVIVSGILHTQADSCLAAGRKAGLKFEKPCHKGKWVTAVGRRP
ncbi:MAG TPA: 50S ribosomal protein L11 methyltransferase [Verrucomicrobiales bacterium]|jgi:ribosomal protein L11 methyltransferase|nr:50S ribosomal protein L11 methyltransferase [Verrucomicrobiales bacterium]